MRTLLDRFRTDPFLAITFAWLAVVLFVMGVSAWGG